MREDRLFGSKALEESFFREREAVLLEKLREENRQREAQENLAVASGIKDEKALKSAVELGVSPESLLALSLVPLVLVAWADRTMEQKEKDAILTAASKQGLKSGTVVWELLESWLTEAPGDGLFDAWQGYVKSLKEKMAPQDLASVKQAVIERATDVAKAAGGLGGIGAVSSQEKAVLAKLEQAFA